MTQKSLIDVLNEPSPLGQLVEKLETANKFKHDMVVKGNLINYSNGHIVVSADGTMSRFAPTRHFHVQTAEKLGIPQKYYDRMIVEYPELLEYNINMWLSKDAHARYLLRCFNAPDVKIARALLSDRYNRIDNYDVLFTALETIKKMGVNVKITKAEITDKRMHLHVVCPDVEVQAEAYLKEYLKKNNAAGNGIVSGFVITNSEIGLGTFEIRPRAVICKCNNGLVVKDDSYKRVHLGSRMSEGVIEWSEATKQKNYELIMLQTRDAIKTFLSKDYLGKMVQRIADASEVRLTYPIDTIQHVTKELGVSDDKKREILSYFTSDGDTSAAGIFHAVTRAAQTMDADTQFEVECNAFDMLPKIKKYDKVFSRN